MANAATLALVEEQDRLVDGIKAEIVEYTGTEVPFGFTENVFLLNYRVWYECKMEDGTLFYAFLRGDGNVFTVPELDEARDFEM